MKKIFFSISVLAFIGLALTSCKKPVTINIDATSADIIVVTDTTSQTGDHTFQAMNVSCNIDSILTASGVSSVADFKSATLKSADITITDPSTQLFDPIDAINGWFSIGSASGTQIFGMNPVPNGVNTLSVPGGTVDITSFLKAKTFSFTVKGTLSAPITQPVTMHIKLHYSLQAQKTL